MRFPIWRPGRRRRTPCSRWRRVSSTRRGPLPPCDDTFSRASLELAGCIHLHSSSWFSYEIEHCLPDTSRSELNWGYASAEVTMAAFDDILTTEQDLRAIMGVPGARSLLKEQKSLDEHT